MRSSTATATTATADTAPYVGRFAPTPSGALHLGSLYAAAASYLEARAHRGRWLLRMEDVDRPREVRGAADRIVRTLEAFGFAWDGAVLRQSARDAVYQSALDQLSARGLIYACRCSRAHLDESGRYPGTCRDLGLAADGAALRLRLDAQSVSFLDDVQGPFAQPVQAEVGDPVVRRRDGLFSYLMAVVVDDAAQAVTHVVRGADLLDSTARQIALQRMLCYTEPRYAHVPLLTEADGAKLAKSRRSVALDARQVISQLVSVFTLLGMPACTHDFAHIDDVWRWASASWSLNNVPKCPKLSITH